MYNKLIETKVIINIDQLWGIIFRHRGQLFYLGEDKYSPTASYCAENVDKIAWFIHEDDLSVAKKKFRLFLQNSAEIKKN